MFAPATVSVGTTAVLVFQGRGRLRLKNNSGSPIYLGPSNAVTASAAAALVLETQPETLEFFEDTDVWAVVSSGSRDLILLATDLPKSVGLSVDCG
jgi:hypothetical protein